MGPVLDPKGLPGESPSRLSVEKFSAALKNLWVRATRHSPRGSGRKESPPQGGPGLGYSSPVIFPLLFGAALAQTLPAGLPVDRALGLHVTNGGLAHFGDVVEEMVPGAMPVTGVGGEFVCDEADAQPLSFSLSDLDLELVAQNAELLASEGRLDLTLYLTLGTSPAELAVVGDCTFLIGLDEVCDVELDVTSATLHVGMTMALSEGLVDVTVDDVSMEMSPVRNPLSDCTLANAIGTLLGQNELALTDLVLSLVEPELEGVAEDIETALEDALGGLVIDTDLALGESLVQLVLEPSALTLDDSGLLLGLSSTLFSSAPSACVDAGAGSEFHDDPWPAVSETAMATSLPYDLALLMSKDFLDHLMWVVWSTGALCIELEEISAGVPLTTELLGPFFGDSFVALFDETQNLALATSPESAPTVSFHEDGSPLSLDLNDFGLQVHARVDDRATRLFRVDLQAEVGLDPGLTAASLAPSIVIDPRDMDFEETVNELLEPGFSAGLADLVPTVLDTFLPSDILPTMALPDIMGIGLEEVFWVQDDAGRWVGGYVQLDTSGVEPLEVPGCDGASLGCEGGEISTDALDFETLLGCNEEGATSCEDPAAGCEDTGCTTSGGRLRAFPFGRMMMLLTAMSLLIVRRRS